MKVSPWIVFEEICAVRIIEGGDVNNVADRVAFIEKTPRVRIMPFVWDDTDWQHWHQGPKGSGGGDGHLPENKLYGFYPPSRKWCDEQLISLGYELPEVEETQK